MTWNERDRLAMFRQVEARQITLVEAAERLSMSYRQVKRMWKRYRELGDGGVVHGLRGRSSNNAPARDARRERALAWYRERYMGFGPTLAAEQLAEREGLTVDHETLRGWLIGAGLWKPRRQPRRSHRRRERRSCFGELVQLDGSDHPWFGEDASGGTSGGTCGGTSGGRPRCVLMVMIDDATGWTEARFFEAETTEASMTIFRRWAVEHGLPRALYPDRHSIYRRSDKEADEIAHRTGERPMTRFGEAMKELGVELICAHSPQAKGRVERANATFQDRLVKLLALEGITDIDAANAYLERTYLPAHNARFAVEPAEADDVHRPAEVAELDAALCPARDRRVVDKTSGGGCVSWRGRCFELTGSDATPRRRREVTVRQRLDGRVELLAVGDGRVLASRELAERPASKPKARPPAAERVAEHRGPSKPTADHPWRAPAVVPGSVPARCARLHSAGHHDPEKGTLLLG